jgi:hypothetical protein
VKQIRLARLEESHAFPVMALYGEFENIESFGTNTVLKGSQGDQAERLQPGDLTVMQEQHANLIERIRRRFAGRVTLGASKYAEGTIVEANQLSVSAYEHYALVLSDLLTQVVTDYANKAAYRAQSIADAISLHKEGLISTEMALDLVSNFYDFNEDQKERFLASKATASSADIAKLLGGGGQ